MRDLTLFCTILAFSLALGGEIDLSSNFFNLTTLDVTKNGIHGVPAVVTTSQVWTGPSSLANVLCQTNNREPLSYCLWTRSSFDKPDSITTKFNVTTEGEQRPGFNYFGQGLRNGDCGITIGAVGQYEKGLWHCTLISQEYRVYLGNVRVDFWEPPAFKPNIENKEIFKNLQDYLPGFNSYIPSKLDVSCCASEGKPDPTLYFQIDNRRVPLENSTFYTKRKLNEVCLTWPNAEFNYTMNGKTLYCIMDHISFKEKDSLHNDSVDLHVEFSPRFIGAPAKDVVKMDIDSRVKSFNISVVIRGNPEPRLTWVYTIPERGNKRRVETNSNYKLTTEQEGDQIRQTLVIVDASLLEVNESVTFSANNYLGEVMRRYEFSVTPGGTDYLVYLLIAIGVAALILVIVGVLLFLFAKNRRKSRLYNVKARVSPGNGNTESTSQSVQGIAVSNRAKDEVVTVNGIDEVDASLLPDKSTSASSSVSQSQSKISSPIRIPVAAPIPTPKQAPKPPTLKSKPTFPATPTVGLPAPTSTREVITNV